MYPYPRGDLNDWARQLTNALNQEAIDRIRDFETAGTHAMSTHTDEDTYNISTSGYAAVDEVRLNPKASSSGPEGTIYYDSDDDHIYVGTE